MSDYIVVIYHCDNFIGVQKNVCFIEFAVSGKGNGMSNSFESAYVALTRLESATGGAKFTVLWG